MEDSSNIAPRSLLSAAGSEQPRTRNTPRTSPRKQLETSGIGGTQRRQSEQYPSHNCREDEKIAVAHYCEGAGHATRMLAVAEGITAAGYETIIAGGGSGKKFVECNGHQEYTPCEVDFIKGYQHGNLFRVLKRCVPNASKRIREYISWLREEEPLLLVTDDITAAVAAVIDSLPYYYVSHDPARFYTTAVERAATKFRNRFVLRTAETFLLPKVWDGPPMIRGTTEIPPIAPRGTDIDETIDVLVVPSAFSSGQDRLVGVLERRGRDVTLVGGADWEVKESLQPYIAEADLVMCSGYSTVMEAAVANTPCILVPETSEQRGVARAIESLQGFYPTRTVADMKDALDRIEAPGPHENGASRVVQTILEGLQAEYMTDT